MSSWAIMPLQSMGSCASSVCNLFVKLHFAHVQGHGGALVELALRALTSLSIARQVLFPGQTSMACEDL